MKKVLFIIIIINFNLLAESGFEAILNIPLGASLGIFNGEIESIGSDPQINMEAAFDAAITVQLGYMFAFGKFAISVLTELGYSYDNFKYSLYHSVSALGAKEEYNIYNNLYLHSLQIGLIPKLNFDAFSLGLGGGIKIPFSGASESKTIKTINIFGTTSTTEDYLKKDYKSSDYLSSIIGYIKFTFDYSFFLTEKTALNLGSYLEYDIGLPYKTENSKGNYRTDSFDIGIQLALRFSPIL
ncbi:hypothetical protein E6A50_02065 [Brachyspira hampsonii]|nr:hypothetical protein [Brachyspira hampsonii]